MRIQITRVFPLLLLIFACSSKTNSEGSKKIVVFSSADSLDYQSFLLDTSKSEIPYNEMKTKLFKERQSLTLSYDSGRVSIDSVSKWFTHHLVYSIIPYWYGTPWAFEGHTNYPNKGEVACGYFVSTTLKHFGVNLNRYKMAQLAALDELKMLVAENDIHKFTKDSTGFNYSELKEKLGTGLFLVGLDFHVGYLLINKEGMFFIHSNYMDPVAVTAENAHESEAFNNTETLYLGRITNKDFLEKFLHQKYFPHQ